MILSGSEYQGGDFIKPEAGTHEATLLSAEAYMNDNYEKSARIPQLTLVWDLGLVENDNGDEVPLLVYDSFINITLNEKAKLTKRLKALADFDETTCQFVMDFEQELKDLSQLPYRVDGKIKIVNLEINGERLFGKTALISLEINDNGYPKVTNVVKPIKRAKAAAKPVETASATPPAPGM